MKHEHVLAVGPNGPTRSGVRPREKRTVLLVDDALTMIALERTLLGDAYDYLEARDGGEAFETAEREQPDVIVMDVCMPRRDGVFALRLLKAHPRTAHIRVILVTTEAQAEALPLEGVGCDALVFKQRLTEDLARAVGQHCARPHVQLETGD